MLYQSVLITGANRGIGLQFVKDFLKLGANKVAKVIATYRDPNTADELNELAKSNSNLSLVKLEAKNYSSYNEFRDEISRILEQNSNGNGLSLLINNAGIAFNTTFANVEPEKMVENYEVNVVAPLMLSKALLPLLQASAKKGDRTMIVHISSSLGSIAQNQGGLGGLYSYRASKAALNMVGKSMSIELEKDGIIVFLLHPGWVKTRLGTDRALLTVEESVSQMMNILTDPTADLNGKFIDYTGKELPW